MDGKALRREPRVRFESIVRLIGTGSEIDAEICDLSRSGCRIRASLAQFQLGESAGLPAILDVVQRALGRQFDLVIHPTRTENGRQVGRSGVLVRMSVVPGQTPLLDLGCLFADPLHDEDARRLGLRIGALDPVEVDVDREGINWELVSGHGARAEEHAAPERPGPVFTNYSHRDRISDAPQRRLVARPKQRHEGEVKSRRPGDTAPGLYCQTETITPHAVLVRASNGLRNLGLRPGVDLATAAVAFTARFGEQIQFSMGPTSAPLWCGNANVCGFELPDDCEEDLVITLSFDRALDPAQMASVGLR